MASRAMALRPMGLLEIVDQTFRLYRQNLWLFLGIAAVVYVPLGMLQAVPVLGAFMGVIFLPAYLVAAGALTKAVSDRYLGEEASVGEAYRHVGRRLWPLLTTTIVAYLFVVSGVVLLVVGAVVFAFWIAFVPQVFIIEGKRHLDAIWRSRFLVGKGVWAQVLVLGLITGALAWLIGAVVGGALGAGLVLGEYDEAGALWGLVMGIIQALVVPIQQVAMVLLYYDSRIRKEGFDLEVLVREMGAAAGGGGSQETA